MADQWYVAMDVFIAVGDVDALQAGDLQPDQVREYVLRLGTKTFDILSTCAVTAVQTRVAALPPPAASFSRCPHDSLIPSKTAAAPVV